MFEVKQLDQRTTFLSFKNVFYAKLKRLLIMIKIEYDSSSYFEANNTLPIFTIAKLSTKRIL